MEGGSDPSQAPCWAPPETWASPRTAHHSIHHELTTAVGASKEGRNEDWALTCCKVWLLQVLISARTLASSPHLVKDTGLPCTTASPRQKCEPPRQSWIRMSKNEWRVYHITDLLESCDCHHHVLLGTAACHESSLHSNPCSTTAQPPSLSESICGMGNVSPVLRHGIQICCPGTKVGRL